jgi:hypothetical protein
MVVEVKDSWINHPSIYVETCDRCHHGGMYWLAFPELEGSPKVCSRCVAEKLLGYRVDWLPQIKMDIAAEVERRDRVEAPAEDPEESQD